MKLDHFGTPPLTDKNRTAESFLTVPTFTVILMKEARMGNGRIFQLKPSLMPGSP